MGVRRFFAGFVVLAALFISPAAALAFNTRITIYASVPQMRVIYVDKAGLITKVAGNTSQNIEPQVLDENNRVVVMTDSISQQYQRFLNEHHNKLQASKIYMINPVSVNNAPNSQTINLVASGQLSVVSLKT